MSIQPDLVNDTQAPKLYAKSQWTPHPALLHELHPPAVKFARELTPEPIDGEQYLWPKDILNRLQDYAFTKGFAIVILSGSEKKGRMRFDCIHHGKARDTRKIEDHDSDTPTGIYSQVEII